MKLTLAQMKARCQDYFFSQNTMLFFRESKHRALYHEETDTNYIRVISKYSTAWYRYDEKTNITHKVPNAEVPKPLI